MSTIAVVVATETLVITTCAKSIGFRINSESVEEPIKLIPCSQPSESVIAETPFGPEVALCMLKLTVMPFAVKQSA